MVQVLPQKTNVGSQIGQSLGMGIKTGLGQHFQNRQQENQLRLENQLQMQGQQQKSLLENSFSQHQASQLKNKMLKLGVPEEIADLYAGATEGGKTAILQNLIDLENRGLLRKGIFGNQPQQEQPNQENEAEFNFPKLRPERGLKPNETVTRESGREKTNIPLYNEAKERQRSFFQENLSLNRLDQLNKSGKLPEGLGRLNVNLKNGELVIPFLATPETQLFVKTINDFTTKAKDSYGGRVTNFELERFMKRLPTLLNSREGAQMVVDQMKIINELNNLHEDSLVKTYDHYGVGKINAQQASSIASKHEKEKEKQLLDRYQSLDGQLRNIQTPENDAKKQERPSLEEIFG